MTMPNWKVQTLCGVAGGLLSWMFAKALGVPALPAEAGLNAILVLVFCLCFGAASAHFGAFLANTDPANKYRLAVFAFLCGFAWKPVLDAGRQYITVHTANTDVSASTQQLANILDSSTKTPSQDQGNAAAVATAIGTQAEQVLAISHTSAASDEPKAQAAMTVKNAVDALSEQALKPSASVQSVDWLFKVGQTSKQLRNDDLRIMSVNKLDYLATHATDPAIKARATELSAQLK